MQYLRGAECRSGWRVLQVLFRCTASLLDAQGFHRLASTAKPSVGKERGAGQGRAGERRAEKGRQGRQTLGQTGKDS